MDTKEIAKGVELYKSCECCWLGIRLYNGNFFCLAAKQQTKMPELVHEPYYKPEWCPIVVVTTDSKLENGE